MRLDGVGVPYDGSVTTAKIANLAVTAPKVAVNAINAAAIVDGAVTESKFSNPESVHAVSMSRQMIINGNMNIAQRGTSFVNPATNAYTLDRYGIIINVSPQLPTTLTHSQLTLTPGELPGSMNAYRITSTGNASVQTGANAYLIFQAIENGVRYFCKPGQQVTVSFYARSSIPGKKIGLDLAQFYGTGGSVADTDYPGSGITLTTEWAHYSYSFPTRTIVGKTLGPDDFLQIRIALAFGPSWNPNFGVGSEPWGAAGTIDFTQLQISEGPVAMPFAQEFYHDELDKCRRYFQNFDTTASSDFLIGSANLTGTSVLVPLRTSPKLRVNPTAFSVSPTGWTITDSASPSIVPTAINFIPKSNESFILQMDATVTAGSVCSVATPTGVYLQLNAELT